MSFVDITNKHVAYGDDRELQKLPHPPASLGRLPRPRIALRSLIFARPSSRQVPAAFNLMRRKYLFVVLLAGSSPVENSFWASLLSPHASPSRPRKLDSL